MNIFGLEIKKINDTVVNTVDPNDKKIANAYRATFLPEQGKIVLDDLLWSLYFFSKAENDEHRIRQNVAREILNKLGIFNDVKSGEIVNKLLEINTLLIEDKSVEGST